MMAQVLFFEIFSEKDPHLNGVEHTLDLLLGRAIDWLKEETLCLNSLSGICTSDSRCHLLHPTFEGKSYLWQVHTTGDSEWSDVKEFINDLIEKAFRNPKCGGCKLG